jgi:hypothetical protein
MAPAPVVQQPEHGDEGRVNMKRVVVTLFCFYLRLEWKQRECKPQPY